jgi:endonuclease I
MKLKILFLLFSTSIFGQIPAYYNSIDFNQTGNSLKTQLATLITNTHTTNLSYTPGVWEALKQTDLNPNNNTNVFLVYGYNDFNASIIDDRNRGVNNNGGNTGDWNREHCYPKSLGNPDLGTTGPGSDAHHLRASDVQFNSNRGNRAYADGEGDAGTVGVNWYPGDEWKGDIARMMMYMYVRYGNQCLATAVGASGTTYHADMPDIFLEWNEEDPVNFYELNRNNILESLQGNRNPFIDNPYLATLIWGGPQASDSWNTLSCSTVTTWNGSSWDNGIPNKDTRAIINGNYTSTGNLEFCSLDIIGTAQVTLESNHTFTIVRALNIGATANLIIQNNANLIQINDVVNSGNITVLKESAPILRLDYTSWSAPVSGQNLLSFSPNTLTNRFYEYVTSGTTPTTAYSAIDPSTNDFIPTKGYIIRAPNNWSSAIASPYFGQFIGVANNGTYQVNTTTGYNMLGNPYPSTIEGSHFIASNRTIETLYFWTHTVAASGGIYPQNNFASYTTLGGVASAAGGQIPDGSIKTGQGFYFYSSEDETILFHNALRYDVKNNQFFRAQDELIAEKGLFRLNLFENNNPTNQILIGYTENSTLGFDKGVDGKIFNENPSSIYTLIDNKKYAINGRGVFKINDSFNLAFKANSNALYKISIENTEGIFTNNAIYLKDNFTGNLINLSKNDYTFLSDAGVFENRFEILYEKSEKTIINTNDFVINASNNSLQLSTSNINFSHVTIFDISGRKFFDKEISSNQVEIHSIVKTNSVLIVKAIFNDGSSKTKKIVH